MIGAAEIFLLKRYIDEKREQENEQSIKVARQSQIYNMIFSTKMNDNKGWVASGQRVTRRPNLY